MMKPEILYTCPCCGDKVIATEVHPNQPRTPHFAEVILDIQAGLSNKLIAARYGLTKGQISGLRYRYWERVRRYSEKQERPSR